MKRQDYVFGSTTSNIEEQTPEALNNGWVELSILYSRVLNGVCAALSQSTNIVSQEVANAIVGMGVTLNPASDNQLLQVLQKLAIKATDFESPITASNKGATMKEIEEVVTSSFRFKGYVSTTQPTGNLVVDNMWINLSTMPSTFPVSASLIKKWDGSAWVNYGSSYTPMNFDAFRNNNDNEGYYWFGGQWKLLSTDLSTDYFRLNQTSGKWEIKSSVNLPGTPTCDTPSASNTRAVVNVDFVNNNTISSRNFTNCLTEIPQDIKLELNDGVLTLKAGSKYYRPDGTYRVIDTDYNVPIAWNAAASGIIVIGNGSYACYAENRQLSGATNPTGLQGNSFLFWNTTENKMYWTTNGGSTWNAAPNCSVPIARVTWGADNKITSIDEIYNGFGYMGSTVFVLPGVRGLIPNGRNEDGTLNNINAYSYNLYAYTRTVISNPNIALTMAGGGYIEPSSLITYDAETNTNTISGTPTQKVVVGKISFGDGGIITLFEPKPTFHAVDYSDFEDLDNSAVHKTGDETVAGIKSFSGLRLRNDVPISKNITTNTETILAQTTLNTAGDIDGASIIRFVSTNGNREVRYRAGFSKRNSSGNIWPGIRVGVDINDNEYYQLDESPVVSSNGTSIATTNFVKSVLAGNDVGLAKFSKTENGYYKFSNGLLIQWGRIQYPEDMTTSDKLTLTFPTPFTNGSSYSVTAIVRSSINENYARGYTSITSPTASTVDFRISNQEYTTGGYAFWIAIGY